VDFKLKYDQFVANKIINRKECTIVRHVYNLKISHIEKDVVDDILKHLD